MMTDLFIRGAIVTIFGAAAVYLLGWLIHSIVVHVREFCPAMQRFDAACARRDVTAMQEAQEQAFAAQSKSLDLLWWVR